MKCKGATKKVEGEKKKSLEAGAANCLKMTDLYCGAAANLALLARWCGGQHCHSKKVLRASLCLEFAHFPPCLPGFLQGISASSHRCESVTVCQPCNELATC